MSIRYPQAITVNNFTGGYRAVSDFTDLSDTETNDSKNVYYGPNRNIAERPGSRRIRNVSLKKTGESSGSKIKGHYFYRKLGNSTGVHVVAAGDRIYDFTSQTANSVLSGQDSSSYFTFAQVQDPRSATDDVVIMSNGTDSMTMYNGSGTAIFLSSLTSATQVPVAKYISSFKNRVYASNVLDSSNIDSPVQVYVSSFGGDGAPDPHRFTENFFVGGSDSDGEIMGQAPLGDSMVFYTQHGIWKFTPGSTTSLATAALRKVKNNIGLLAPRSLVDAGGFHIFLSSRGVWTFDGASVVHISEKVDEDLYENSNLSELDNAVATFDSVENRYILYYASAGSSVNDTGLAFDVRIKSWQPPITGRRVATISKFIDSDGIRRVLYGDYRGYLYQDGLGTADGLNTGYSGTATGSTTNTLTDSTASFDTDNDGLTGQILTIVGGSGKDQSYVIKSNTATELTIEGTFAPGVDTTSEYAVGAIDSSWRSKDYDFGIPDISKMFRHIRVRTKEGGNYNLLLQYIIEFSSVEDATIKALALIGKGLVWGTGLWGIGRWGSDPIKKTKVSLRSTSVQSNIGTHLALRFYNRNPNENWVLNGFDIELKQIGRR